MKKLIYPALMLLLTIALFASCLTAKIEWDAYKVGAVGCPLFLGLLASIHGFYYRNCQPWDGLPTGTSWDTNTSSLEFE
jgi:hypothetical protein